MKTAPDGAVFFVANDFCVYQNLHSKSGAFFAPLFKSLFYLEIFAI